MPRRGIFAPREDPLGGGPGARASTAFPASVRRSAPEAPATSAEPWSHAALAGRLAELTGLGGAATLLLIIGVVALRRLAQTDQGSYLVDRWKLRLPFFGALFSEYALSAFCRTLSTTLASGITVVQSMQMARGVLNNRVLEERMAVAVRKIQEGTKISEALEQTGTFPIVALRMIGVGESSGSLGDMLTDVADYYESEVDRRLERLATLIEPLMMVIMGVLVGGTWWRCICRFSRWLER